MGDDSTQTRVEKYRGKGEEGRQNGLCRYTTAKKKSCKEQGKGGIYLQNVPILLKARGPGEH